MSDRREASPVNWQRMRRAALRALVTLIVLLALLPTGLGFVFIIGLTNTPCGGSIDPATVGLPSEPVVFPSGAAGRDVRGFFVAGSNGATIIIPPAMGSGAGSQMAEIAVFQRNGYNVLSYESRPCMGLSHSLGRAEVDEVGAALAYLNTRADVDPERIAVHGFSSGGATAIMAAARFPQIRAVIAMGGYADFDRYLDEQIAGLWYAPLLRAGADAAYWLAAGQPMSQLSPLSAIGQIAPRPVLLIYGSDEPSLGGGRQQLAAAGTGAELWELPGATHGSYVYTAPQAFEARTIAFLDAALGTRR